MAKYITSVGKYTNTHKKSSIKSLQNIDTKTIFAIVSKFITLKSSYFAEFCIMFSSKFIWIADTEPNFSYNVYSILKSSTIQRDALL